MNVTDEMLFIEKWSGNRGFKQPTEVSDVLLSPITSVQWCFTVDLVGQLFSFSSDLFSSSFSAPCFPETNWEAHSENKERLNAELIKGQSLLKVQGSCFCCFQSFALTRTPNGFINLPQIANSNKGVDCLRICFGSWRLVCSWDRVWVQTRSLAGFYCPARAHLCSSFFMVVLRSNSYMISAKYEF